VSSIGISFPSSVRGDIASAYPDPKEFRNRKETLWEVLCKLPLTYSFLSKKLGTESINKSSVLVWMQAALVQLYLDA
jgi:hypothetical protein